MTQDLFDAITAGDLNQVKNLLKRDPSLANARSKRGTPAAVFALYVGRKDISDAILAAGPTLDLPSAAAVGRVERVKEFLARDPWSVDTLSGDGYTALGLASYLGQTDVVVFLLSKGADANYVDPSSGFTALTGAISSDHADVVRMLVEHGADVNHRYEEGNTPLTEAAFNGNPTVVNLLLDHGARVDVRTAKGQTALAIALERGHKEVADLLRKHGAQP